MTFPGDLPISLWLAALLIAFATLALLTFAITRPSGRSVVASTAVIATCGLVIAGALLHLGDRRDQSDRVRQAVEWVEHTSEVIFASHRLLAAVEFAESSQRNFLISQNAKFVEDWHRARDTIWNRIAALRALTEPPERQQRVAEVVQLISDMLQIFDVTLERARVGDTDAVNHRLRTEEGAAKMQQVRDSISALIAEERRLLAERRTEADAQYTLLWKKIDLLTGTGLILFMLFAGALCTLALVHARTRRDLAITAERLRGETLLARSEARFRTLVEALPQLIWTCTPDGACSYLSPQWVGYTGRSEASQLEYGWVDALHPDDREHLLRTWKQSVETCTPFDSEARIRGTEGGYRWFKQRALPCANNAGAVEWWIGISTDITSIIEEKAALARSEQRLRQFISAAPVAIAMFDREMKYLAASQRFSTDYGLDDQPLVGRSHYEVFPQIPPHWRDIHRRCLQGAIERSNGEQFERADGSIDWVRWEIQPWRDDAGEIGGIVLFTEDITARIQAEQDRQKYVSLVGESSEFIGICDLQYRPLFVNNAGLRMVGLASLEQALRVSVKDFFFPEDQSFIFEQFFPRVLREGRAEVEIRLRHFQTGEPLWTLYNVFYLSDDNGRLTGLATVSRNITERKQAEEALFREKERAQVTLHSIGDAVITTDNAGRIEYLNPVAETLTGWSCAEAAGLPLSSVFQIINEQTRIPGRDPVTRCLAEGQVVGLANHTVLISRTGEERAIADSAAPIRGRDGSTLGAVLVFHDVTETRRLARQLEHDAAHDALTGLVNRREFEQRLERAFVTAQRYTLEHALCYFDLDQFKLINDTAGHAAGDTLLKQVRGLLTGKFRERDTLARLGGDEFALLLESCPLSEACRIAELVVNAFREWQFNWSGRTFQVGVSAGVVAITAEATSAQQLLAEADVACYAAKEQGRNRVHVYRKDGAQPSPHHAQMLMASTLRDALAENRFCLHAQPIVSLGGDVSAFRHYEVLLRMLDSADGMILPGTFIPAAERYGLMAAIDRWVIKHALQAYAALNGAGEHVQIAINLSGESLSTPDLSQYVLHQFDAYDIRSERVCFEITETAAIQHLDHALQFIESIKQRGSCVALDDFGSGLSSFRYLRELPADYLKIDGSFVRNMSRNDHDEAMVAAINEVGHKLGIATVAEYAHNQETVESLRHLGVDYAQGYALGVPQPLERLLATA